MKIKKILSLLLCLCMIAGFIPFVAKKAEAAEDEEKKPAKKTAAKKTAKKDAE